MAFKEPMNVADKRDCVDMAGEIGATINGNRALVSGYMNDYATVTDATTGMSCEFAWPTVRHILRNKNGEFKS